MDNLTKAQIALLATLLGWLLGQGAELIRSYLKNRVIKKALLAELSDILNKLKLNTELCEKSITALNEGLKGVTVYPQPILLPIYNNKYSEACMLFNAKQRESLNVIYSHILAINKRLDSPNNNDSATRLFEIFVDSIWAQESIKYFFSHNGSKQLRDDDDVLKNINEKFSTTYDLVKQS